MSIRRGFSSDGRLRGEITDLKVGHYKEHGAGETPAVRT